MFFSNCSLDTVLSCGLSTNQHNGFPLPFFLCLRSSFRKSQLGSLAQTGIENFAHDKFIAFSGRTFVVRRRAFWHLSASDILKCSPPRRTWKRGFSMTTQPAKRHSNAGQPKV